MRSTRRRIVVREYEGVGLNLGDEDLRVLHGSFSFAAGLKYVRSGRWELKPQQYVGTIVTPNFEVRVRPKCGLQNLFRLLAYGFGLVRIREELVKQEIVDDLREFLVAVLVAHLEAMVRHGLQRGYVEDEDDLRALRGRLLLDQQLRRRPGSGLVLPCRYEDFTDDLPFNQVIRFTLAQIGPTGTPELNRRLRRMRAVFGHVTHHKFKPSAFDRFCYDRLTRSYEPIHALCRVILEGRGAEQDSGVLPMGSFLVDMNLLFERFVARWLADHVPKPWRVSAQYKSVLDWSGHVRIRPDLVLSRGATPRTVADTKYKMDGGAPSNADAYQALAYCRALGLRRAWLIYPDVHGTALRLIVRDDANEVISDGVDLSARWEVIEAGMKSLMARVIESAGP